MFSLLPITSKKEQERRQAERAKRQQQRLRWQRARTESVEPLLMPTPQELLPDSDDDNCPAPPKRIKMEELLLKREQGNRDNFFDGEEATFCALLANEWFPEAYRVMSNFHSGPGRLTFGSSHRQKADCTVVVRDGGKMRLAAFNYHGHKFHNQNGFHRPGCPAGTNSGAAYPRKGQDDFKKRLAFAMSKAAAAAGMNCYFTYDVVWSCSVFCHFDNLDPMTLMGSKVPARPEYSSNPWSLLRHHHKDKCVFGIKNRSFSQKSLLEFLMADDTRGGFVVCEGGEIEDKNDYMGYCLQRVKTDYDELGEYTKWQALQLCNGDEIAAKKLLEHYCANDQTVLRNSFKSESESLSVSYFKWLVTVKGYKNYKITHYCYFYMAKFLSPFLNGMLEKRHQLRISNGSILEQNCYKIALNSHYGYHAISSKRFTKTSVLKASTLAKKNKAFCSRIMHLSLLGAVKDKNEYPQLLYAVTVRNTNAKIRNLIQTAGTILGTSKVVFLHVMSELQRLLDPTLAEVNYSDTDSYLIGTAYENLVDCLKDKNNVQNQKDLAALFEIPNASFHQSGLLKREQLTTVCVIRNAKSYMMGEDMRRMKGVSRKIQAKLKPEVFGPNVLTNRGVIRNVSMAPTAGMEIVLSETSLSLTHSFNLKRNMQVRGFS